LGRDRRLEHDDSPWAYQVEGGGEPGWRAGRVDDEVGARARRAGVEPEPRGERELLRMPPREHDLGACAGEHLRDEEPELAVAEHDRPRAADAAQLLQDLEGGGQRLREDRGLIGELVGTPMEHASRNRQQVGEGTVGVDDALHPAGRTVARETRPAPGAGSAAEGDLADDPRPDERGIRRRYALPDPLVPGRAAEAEVPAADLEVGAADAGQAHADHRVLRTGPGLG